MGVTSRQKFQGLGMKLLSFCFASKGVALRMLGKDSRWLGDTIFCLIDGVRNLVASIREGNMSWL